VSGIVRLNRATARAWREKHGSFVPRFNPKFMRGYTPLTGEFG